MAQGGLVAESESVWGMGSTRESHAQEDAHLWGELGALLGSGQRPAGIDPPTVLNI